MGLCLLLDQATPSFIKRHLLNVFLFPIFAFGCKYISLYKIIIIIIIIIIINITSAVMKFLYSGVCYVTVRRETRKINRYMRTLLYYAFVLLVNLNNHPVS